jgi:arylsulfatase A-like enzyme
VTVAVVIIDIITIVLSQPPYPIVRPNILLVVLDSARVQNMSLYGYDRNTTPFLERFAERSTLYTQARAPSIHSIASHVSMFTGLHLEEHRATDHESQIDTSQSIWKELSREFGYDTGLFTNNYVISQTSNLKDCFEYNSNMRLRAKKKYLGRNPIGQEGRILTSDSKLGSAANHLWNKTLKLRDRIVVPDRYAPGDKFVDSFLDWQEDRSDPWAACINLMDTHYPFQPEPEFDNWGSTELRNIQEDQPGTRELLDGRGWSRLEALEPLYDGSLLQADAIVKKLVTELERRSELDETLLVITSDHGEGFGEHSRTVPGVRMRRHSWGIHEVLTHVPLVINYPEQRDGTVVRTAFSLTDIPEVVRTVLDGASIPPTIDRSPVLSSTLRLLPEKAADYDSIDGVEKYVGPWRAVYDNADGSKIRKHVQKDEYFATIDIRAPGDVEVVSTEPTQRVEEVFEQLSESDVQTETAEIDDESRERLKDLGYIR